MCYDMQAATVAAVVKFEDFRDYASSQYTVTISRAQQLTGFVKGCWCSANTVQTIRASKSQERERAKSATCLLMFFFETVPFLPRVVDSWISHLWYT